MGSARFNNQGILGVEYGYYPQTIVSPIMQSALNLELKKGTNLRATGNSYTYNRLSTWGSGPNDIMKYEHCAEYDYMGNRYVRVPIIESVETAHGNPICFSNNEEYEFGDYVWMAVEPVVWLVDKKNHFMVTKKVMYAGVPFSLEKDNSTVNVDTAEARHFLNSYWGREISQNKVLKKDKPIIRGTAAPASLELLGRGPIKLPSRVRRLNPDTTPENERKPVTYSDLIGSWIENGQSVLLRGPSGIGKTSIVKSLYPDAIYLKLTNNMLPEKVVGSLNLQTGNELLPSFAREAILRATPAEEREEVRKNLQNSIYDKVDDVYEKSK